MAARNNAINQQRDDRKNYRSRYDRNRDCYREDKSHYVYQHLVINGDNRGFYSSTVLSVGDEGVTYELLDFLQETDNSEVQDIEDDLRNAEKLAYSLSSYEDSYEEVICSDNEDVISPILKAFNELVRPHLSVDQMNLIYARYGMDMTLDEIALSLPLGKNGKPISHQAVANRFNRIFAKVRKYMTV